MNAEIITMLKSLGEQLDASVSESKGKVDLLYGYDRENSFDVALKAMILKHTTPRTGGDALQGAFGLFADISGPSYYKAKAARKLLLLRQHRKVTPEHKAKISAEILPVVR
ncbi:MAG: hypothetical protein J0H19_15235, partial [Rhodospirillales bacterium]|nr:hypothetical protein [Rhodospirillales bacterium]